jgi:hypothetical protein
MVCERTALRLARSEVAFCHQALSVVDWCKARARGCVFTGCGNAVWFGNRCTPPPAPAPRQPSPL